MDELKNLETLTSKYNLSQEELCRVLEAIPANVFFKDTECRYRMASQVCQMLNSAGDPNFTIFGKTDAEIQPNKELGEKFYKEDLKIIQTGEPMSYLQDMTFGDLTFYYQISKQPVKNADGKILGIVGIIVDMTEQIRMQKELERYSIIDPMTGIYNRSYFEKRMENFGKKADEQYPIAVIVADCDHLKVVNDNLGHKAGDFLIQSTVGNLKRSLPDSTEFIRMGGDEFLMILPNCDENTCRKYMDEVNRFEQKLHVENVKLSTSLGYAIISDGQTSLAQAVEAADAMMYENKALRHRE